MNVSPPSWDLAADVEALDWDPHNPTVFVVSLENGEVIIFDARSGAGSPSLLRLAAHNKSTTAVAFNPQVSGLLLTGSTDKRVKIWEISTEGSLPPRELACEDLKVGAIFGAAFCRDAPLLVAAGGAKGAVAVWDTRQNEAVAEYAQSRTEV
jgi:periodic tryptophan protein 1